jgi:iron complex transport system permease protein
MTTPVLWQLGRATHVAAAGDAVVVPARLRPGWLAGGVLAVAVALVAGLAFGPVSLPLADVLRELLWLDSGLSDTQRTVLWEIRLPRVVLGLLVGSILALSGASYQGAFRNPLADPYLLGAAAGAGLGVTMVIVAGADGSALPVGAPVAAFAGSLLAVALTYLLGSAGTARASTASLILAGVAVATFLTAAQTYVQQRNLDTVQQVYNWVLGRLVTAGWREVWLVVPYIAVSTVVLLAQRRTLDVLAVGDDEATSLGLDARRARLVVVAAASLGTAAAVAVSGLIAFMGIIVPHTVRLLAGSSNRVVLPLSCLFGGAFLVGTDLLARTLAEPAEIPIGVVTAFFGAPFFVLVLRTRR